MLTPPPTSVPEDAGRAGAATAPGPRWGLGDVAVGFVAGLVLEVFAILLVSSVTDYATGGATGTGAAFGQVVGHVAVGRPPTYVGPMPLWLQAIVQIPLWACLLGVPLFATITKGSGPVRDLGLRIKAIDVPVGVALGLAAQLVLVPLIYWPFSLIWDDLDVSGPARDLTNRATDPLSIVMLLVIVGIGAPVAEEVFFRGLTQRSVARRFGPWVALVGTAAFFAATHFEPLQFPALFAFGLILGALAWATGRLGPSIFAHLAFNLAASVTLVWNVGLEPWATVLVGVAGLAAVGYLIAAPRLAREKPPPVTASR